MGQDKAFLKLGGKTLLARALELVGTVSSDVRIVGDPGKFMAFGTVIEDVYRERGPLGGIHAALAESRTDLNLMLAVDLPFVEARFLTYLLSQARACEAVVTVPRAAGGLQPLCAAYRREFRELAERSLLEGRNKIDALFADGKTHVLEEEKLLGMGFAADMFRNLNTVEELQQANEPLRARSTQRSWKRVSG